MALGKNKDFKKTQLKSKYQERQEMRELALKNKSKDTCIKYDIKT